MPTKTAKKRRPRVSSDELMHRVASLTLSKEQLRKLVKKYPAPQQWYDEDTGFKPVKKK